MVKIIPDKHQSVSFVTVNKEEWWLYHFTQSSTVPKYSLKAAGMAVDSCLKFTAVGR